MPILYITSGLGPFFRFFTNNETQIQIKVDISVMSTQILSMVALCLQVNCKITSFVTEMESIGASLSHEKKI